MAIIDGKIKCSRCQESKDLGAFQRAVVARKSGQCRPCKQAIKKEYYWRHPEKNREAKRRYYAKRGPDWRRECHARAHQNNPLARKHYSLARYGIGIDDFQKMLEQQNHGCAICGTKENSSGKTLFVDHDHVTGSVRGLLCHKCNSGLGLLGDNIEGIEKVMKYLKGAMT